MFKHAFDRVSPSVVRITYEEGPKVISAGTGFFFRGFLVTNFHVYQPPGGRDVRIKFAHYHDVENNDVVIGDAQFHDSFVGASPEGEFDYAFFDPFYVTQSKRTLLNRLWSPRVAPLAIGDEVGIAGFPFGKDRIAGHLCRVSSIYRSGPAVMIQLEGSINNSNSGGPLFNFTESAVIGVVTRKESGLTNNFRLLVKEVRKDIANYENGALGPHIGETVRDAIVKTERHLLTMARELERSTNTGIGYAISIEHIMSNPNFQTNAMPDPFGTI